MLRTPFASERIQRVDPRTGIKVAQLTSYPLPSAHLLYDWPSNWPDQGLHLVHVPTGHFAPLCHSGATQDHYEFGHPHPALSQDGSLCVFRSDRTGVPQIYIAHISNEFRERVIAGELDASGKWMP